MNKKRRLKKIPLVVYMLLNSLFSLAQERVPEQVYFFNDSLSGQVDGRKIPAELIEQYCVDEAFDYRYGYQQTVSIWQQLWQWILQQLSKLFGEVNFNFPITWLLYIFCALMIIFAVMKLMGVSISGLFNRQKPAPNMNVQDILGEDIHEINFEEEINKAQQAQDYRRAIRLLYIFTLKKLADSDRIVWHPGKTNADYQKELEESSLKNEFRSLSIYYDYAWYGEFPVDANLYEKVNILHQSIDQQLSVSA